MELLNYDTEWSLQKALLKALRGDAQLAAILANHGVYDHVPATSAQGVPTPTPYVVIGDDTVGEWDTKTEIGEEITVTLHIWSTYSGRKEVKIIQGHIKRILHDQLLPILDDNGIATHVVVLARREFTETIQDPDGATMHGICRYRYILHSV